MTDSPTPRRRRLAAAGPRGRITVIGVAAGLLATGAIALSMNGTLAGFVASITNSNDTAATGYLSMSESSTVNSVTTTCSSSATNISTDSATCTGINKYGGSTTLVPGASSTTTVTITNTGTVPANTFTMAFGACTQGNNGTTNGNGTTLCKQMTLATTQGGTALAGASGTAYALGGGTVAQPGTTVTLNAPVAAGASVTFVFTMTFTSTGAPSTDDALQGLSISQPITWTFGS